MRKTEYWKDSTPAKLGPGAYELQPSQPCKPSAAPFAQARKRDLSEPSKDQAAQPGPTSYGAVSNWAQQRRATSSFSRSKSPRLLPFAPGVTGYVLPSNYNNPGPGAYEAQPAPPSSARQRKKVQRSSSLAVDPSPPSIPCSKPAILAPASSIPSDRATRQASRFTCFGSYKAKRTVFNTERTTSPGPGEYSIEVATQAKPSWVFSSCAKRAVSQKLEKSDKPGPGTYNTERESTEKSLVTVEGFGSTSRRDIKTSRDPHRPYLVGPTAVPPVGTYYTKDQLSKQEKLKQKFLSYEPAVEKPPFGASQPRNSPVPSAAYPGPGQYNSSRPHTSPNKPVGSKAPRFPAEAEPKQPGPGTYETERSAHKRTRSAQFLSNAPRFTGLAQDNPTVRLVGNTPCPESYLAPSQWAAPQSQVPALSFGSSSIRKLHPETSETPGPGAYSFRTSNSAACTKRSAKRFDTCGSYNLHTGTSRMVGPGKYYKPSTLVAKSYNMSGENNSHKPWM